MKKILLIGTGGTIASTYSDHGLVPGISPDGILKYVPEISKLCEVDALQIFNIDSTNVTPEHWLEIARTIKENYEKYDGFLPGELLRRAYAADKLRTDEIEAWARGHASPETPAEIS